MTNDKSELAARLERAEAIIQTLGGKNGAEKGPLAELKYIVREIRTALPESDIGYKTLLDSVNDLAWIASADGAMLYMNPATAHIYGRPAEDFFNNSERLIEAVHPEDRAEAAKNREKLFALGEVEQTYRIIRPDGEIRWLHDNKKILSDSAGKPLYIRGIATDITEQKELETAQRESEITAKLLIDNPMAAVLLLNSEGVILDINETMEYRFNLSRNQLIGKQMLELLPPKVATRYQEYIGRVIRTGGLLRMEDEWDGRWFDHVIQPIFDSHGKVAKIAFIVRNITAHKLTEKALSKERDKAQIYLNLAGVMFMALDADGCVNMVNRKTCEILEYRQEEIIGWNWFDNFLQEEDKLEVKAIFSRLMCGEIEAAEYYESPVRTRSGKETLIAWHNRVIRNRKEEITGALCSGEDITARKRAEKALKHRLQMEKTIAEVSTLFINITRGRFNYDIDQALRLLGEFSGMDRCYLFQVLEQGELISDIHEWCAPEIEPRIEFLQQLPFSAFPWIKERLQRFETVHIPCVTGLPPLAGAEKANFQKQGIQSLVIVPIRDADTLTGFLGFDSVSAKKNWPKEDIVLLKTVADIFANALARRQTVTALRGSEKRFRRATAAAKIGIWDWELNKNSITWSDSVEPLFGLPAGSLKGNYQGFLELVYAEDIEQVKEKVSQALTKELPYIMEYRVQWPDGSLHWQGVRGRMFRDAQGKPARMAGTVMDITERKSFEVRNQAYLHYLESMERVNGIISRGGSDLDETLRQIIEAVQAIFACDRVFLTYPCDPSASFWRMRFETARPEYSGAFALNKDQPMTSDVAANLQAVLDSAEPLLDRQTPETLPPKTAKRFSIQATMLTAVRPKADKPWQFGVQQCSCTREWTAAEQRIFKDIALRITDALSTLLFRRELRETEAHMRSLMDNSPDHIMLLDRDAKILFINYTLSDLTWKEVVGTSVYKYMPKQFRRIAAASFKRVLETAEPDTYTTGHNSAEGEIRHFDVRVGPVLRNGQVTALVSCSTDITARKQAEHALAEERALLARRVKERTAELRKANTELARAARLKDEFLANMSHELRTPLNAVLGMSELLQERIYGPLNEKQSLAVKRIDTSGHHLLSLINDILDLSKIAAGKMELHPEAVKVAVVCQESMQFVKQAAAQKKIKLPFVSDYNVEFLQADGRCLKQILINLLNNAVKFTPEGGHVQLEMEGNETQNIVRFSVTDTGIGIPEAELEHLFQPFVQVDGGLSRAHEGTGLGLALVYRLAEMHGGSVAVESTVGKGSTFTVTLPWHTGGEEPVHFPFSQSEAGEDFSSHSFLLQRGTEGDFVSVPPGDSRLTPHSSSGETDSSKKSKTEKNGKQAAGPILLAEDNEANLMSIRDGLVGRGYKVEMARNGAEAVELAREKKPAVILMDIQMPVMDGLEASRQIRADPELAEIPIIALTALAMPGDREKCLKAGANEYLSKPVTLKILVETIRRV